MALSPIALPAGILALGPLTGGSIMSPYNVNPKYHTQLSIGPYRRTDSFSKGDWRPELFIHLPLPQELRDETAIRMQDVDLGVAENFMQGDVSEGLTAGSVRALRALAGDSVGTAIEQYFGGAVNPNPTVAFQGMNLREFTLTWTLQPTNQAESRKTHQVINRLKRAALPVNALAGDGAVLKYPDLVQPNFMPWDTPGHGDWGHTDKSIIRAKRCFMSSVNAVYNPSNQPAFFETTENPVIIQLTVAFKEVEYLVSADYGGADGDSGWINDLVEAGNNIQNDVTQFGLDQASEFVDALFGGDN